MKRRTLKFYKYGYSFMVDKRVMVKSDFFTVEELKELVATALKHYDSTDRADMLVEYFEAYNRSEGTDICVEIWEGFSKVLRSSK